MRSNYVTPTLHGYVHIHYIFVMLQDRLYRSATLSLTKQDIPDCKSHYSAPASGIGT